MAGTPKLCPTCRHVAESCAPMAWNCEDRFHFITMPANPGWYDRFQAAGRRAFAGVTDEAFMAATSEISAPCGCGHDHSNHADSVGACLASPGGKPCGCLVFYRLRPMPMDASADQGEK